ncbi:MAG: hypothetical protein AB8B85_21435 [Paracoccaceae bacterium]
MMDHCSIRQDASDLAFRLAHPRFKAVLVSCLHGLVELPDAAHPTALADDLATILRYRLDRTERGFLLMTAAQAAEPEDLGRLALAVCEGTAEGTPHAPFLNVKSEARDWAMFANVPERRAYLTAIWSALSAADKQSFLKAVSLKRRAHA